MVITILGLRNRVRIVYGDFFTQDLSEADVVTCYLLRSTNIRLQEKFKDELRPETRVVSNYFTFPALNMVSRDEEAKLYLYNLKRD